MSVQSSHAIAPLEYAGSQADAMQRLLAVLGTTPRLRVITVTPDYIHAEVRTPIMRYVDDVEFLVNSARSQIDVRSSSRIGYYDFQVNRERIEDLRRRFASN